MTNSLPHLCEAALLHCLNGGEINSHSTMQAWTMEHKDGHKTGWLWQISWNCWHAQSQKFKYSYCKNKISCSCLCFSDSNVPKGCMRWLGWGDCLQTLNRKAHRAVASTSMPSRIPGKLQDQTLTSWNKELHSLYLFWKQTHTSMLKQVKMFH